MSKKNLKKALIPSLIALVLCFAMLLGTTFAWFTDTAETGTNVIASGNLSIDLFAKTDYTKDYAKVDKTTVLLGDDILWEPGYTAVIYAKIVNTGDLAVKYTMNIVVAEAEADPNADPDAAPAPDLSKAIKVYYAPSADAAVTRDLSGLRELGTLYDVLNDTTGAYAINDTLEAKNDEDYATIVLVMDPAAGNEYQGLSIGNGFSFKVVATQAAVESDSIDDQYDADASFPG